MLFNSTEYLVLLLVTLVLYQALQKNIPLRNGLLLLASWVFYGWWSIEFLALMIITTSFDYFIGGAISRCKTLFAKRVFLLLSLVVSLGVLFYFKYRGFFYEMLDPLLRTTGYVGNLNIAAVVLPVGISFYTFQSISYVMDVYRGVINPARNIVEYLSFVTFFPQLVAGPIERASHLLPQFQQLSGPRVGHLQEAFWLILWGMFKKVVIGDNLAPLVDLVYSDPPNATAASVILATIAFGAQIYCDFSGYSDIARGSGKLFGFDIMFNFNLPYWSTNIREFWGRWHISLSTWFRDYLYLPLGGNRKGRVRTIVNLLLVMTIAGLWHGAAITFLLWGLIHGLALAAHRTWLWSKPDSLQMPRFIGWTLTMFVVFAGWMFFRASTLLDLRQLLTAFGNWSAPQWFASYCITLIFFLTPVILVEWFLAKKQDLLAVIQIRPWPRALLQSFCLALVLMFWKKDGSPFIYFQF